MEDSKKPGIMLFIAGLTLLIISFFTNLISPGFAIKRALVGMLGFITVGIGLTFFISNSNGGKNKIMRFYQSIYDFFKKHVWLEFAIILFFIALNFWTDESWASPDVAYYLSLAKNLYRGIGYVNPDLTHAIYRGPILPVLIAFSYRIFGEFFRSALIVERLFWAATILISYILGWKLFNRRVGFMTALFVLSIEIISMTFNFIWTDGPLVFFILLLQLIFWQAYKKDYSYLWYIFTGLVMGIAYLLKQTAALIAPLPFIIFLIFPEYRTRKTLKHLLVFAAVFSLFVVGWMWYVHSAGGSPGQVAGDFRQAFSLVSRFKNVFNNTNNVNTNPNSYSISIFQIFKIFYERDIVQFFKFAIVFPLGLGVLIYQSIIKKSRPDIFLLFGVLLFSYLIPSQVVVDYNYRTNLYFYIIGLLYLAVMIDRLSLKVGNKFAGALIAFLITGFLIYIQTAGVFFIISKPKLISNSEKTMGYFNVDYQPLADWINENILPSEIIMMNSRDSNYLHILTDGNRRFEEIYNCSGEDRFSPASRCVPPYISLWIHNRSSDINFPRDSFLGISEPWIIENINENHVDFIIVTPRTFSLYQYLSLHPGFEFSAIVNDSFAIFRIVQPVKPISSYPDIIWNTCLGAEVPQYLQNLKQANPARYQYLLNNHIEPWMGLTDQDLDAFKNWQGCKFGEWTSNFDAFQ